MASLSRALSRMQTAPDHVKHRDLRQTIGYKGDGRLGSPAEDPEISVSHRQPARGWRDNTRRCYLWSCLAKWGHLAK